ncbi:hypothetical protein [Deinococcus roseus]|uniref:Uncharacterized protein n=1 Tax=Deinococcus roseus TaxID=392414 RepID=A0ABQ2DGY2_9DEIO|nr:hypothetical protein [Deinococcus roseus]GGJ55849.1 hypothetical protein GCM10008938_47530 [Deinococcus roseus]
MLISDDLTACRALRSEHLKPHVNDGLREYALKVLQPEQQTPLFPDLASVTPETISPLFPGMAF